MGLVDDEARDPEVGEALLEARGRQALGGDVEESQPAVERCRERFTLLPGLHLGVDRGRGNPGPPEAEDLVGHQGDEG